MQNKAGRQGFLSKITFIAIGMMLSTSLCAQQSIRANEVESTLDTSFRSMYNLQFDEALRSVQTAKSMDTSDPRLSAKICGEKDLLRLSAVYPPIQAPGSR